MQSFLKIVFFIFTMIVAAEEAQSSTVVTILEKETSCLKEITGALNAQYSKYKGERGTNAEFYILQLAFDKLREDINHKKIN